MIEDQENLATEGPAEPPARSFLANVFLSPGEPRLRAGWRLLGQEVIMVVFLAIFTIGAGLLFIGGMDLPDPQTSFFLGQIISALGITLSVMVARQYLDRRSFSSLGLHLDRRAARDVLAGAIFGGLMFGLIFLLHLGAGWLDFAGYAWEIQPNGTWLTSLLVYLIIFAVVAWQEELLSRGYWLQNLADGLGWIPAVLLSALAFGLLHVINPGASLSSTAGIFLAGIFFAFAYLRVKNLWLPIGLHLGWNFFEGPVFGFPVSGIQTFRLLSYTVSGPDLWTGGAFGPEAGLAVIPALLLGAILIIWYGNRFAQK